jgi:hypothetical protein
MVGEFTISVSLLVGEFTVGENTLHLSDYLLATEIVGELYFYSVNS